MKFIRDDIRVRDLDARYKKTMRKAAAMYADRIYSAWGARFERWTLRAAVEKVHLKGA